MPAIGYVTREGRSFKGHLNVFGRARLRALVTLPLAFAIGMSVSDPAPAKTRIVGLFQPELNLEPMPVPGAVSVTAFGSIDANQVGTVTFEWHRLSFSSGDRHSEILFKRIAAFSIEHIDKRDGGAAGDKRLVATRRHSETRQPSVGIEVVTIVYRDRYSAIHAAVFELPAGGRQVALQAFSQAGLRPSPRLIFRAQSKPSKPTVAVDTSPSSAGSATLGAPTVTVLFPRQTRGSASAASLARSYEAAVAKAQTDGSYGAVWREGDVRAGAMSRAAVAEVSRPDARNSSMASR